MTAVQHLSRNILVYLLGPGAYNVTKLSSDKASVRLNENQQVIFMVRASELCMEEF